MSNQFNKSPSLDTETGNRIDGPLAQNEIDAMLVSIIVATFNERDNILGTVKAVLEHVPAPVEVIVVDDNSPDLTWKIIDDLDDLRVKLVVRKKAKGLASAVVRGLMESRGKIVGWIDADMASETEYLPQMIKKLTDQDVVIASRFVEGGLDDRHPVRVYASHLVNGFARLFLGYKIMDFDSCVAVMRREVFDEVLPIPFGFGDFFIEFVYGCCKKGLRVHEHPYTLNTREGGASKSFPSLGGFLWLGSKYVFRIIATRFRTD